MAVTKERRTRKGHGETALRERCESGKIKIRLATQEGGREGQEIEYRI